MKVLFKDTAERATEFYEQSRLIVANAVFNRLGLADAAIASLCPRSFLVLTDDLELYRALTTRWLRRHQLQSHSNLLLARLIYSPALFHNSSTRCFTSLFIRISPGHGREKPSPGHFRVASIPIFEPKFGRRLA